jgi:hypothetical protein
MESLRPAFVSAAFAALTGCGSTAAPVGFPAQPIMTLSSMNHQLSVSVRTSPQPPTRGDQSVEYTIADPTTGKPLTGLTLDVVPWMPIMNHGTSIVPSVTETVPGTYVLSNVDLFMAGEWALRTTISGTRADSPDGSDSAASVGDAGIVSDYVSPTFEIP